MHDSSAVQCSAVRHHNVEHRINSGIQCCVASLHHIGPNRVVAMRGRIVGILKVGI